MVEEEKTTEAADTSANGTCPPEDMVKEDMVKDVTEAKEEARDELKAKEEDVKTEVDKNKDSEEVQDGKTKDDVKEEEDIKSNEEGEIKNNMEEEIKNNKEGSENEKEEANIEVIKPEKENNAEEDMKNKIVEENIEESEETEVAEEKVEQKKTRMRGKGVIAREKGTAKKEVGEKKTKEPRTPTSYSIDRPVRERKTVERLVAIIEKEPAKEFLIGKGRGTALKDIPNVAFKLSRKKTDETFKALHVILFGRRGKAFNVKYNISQFSGFVWHENEEKQRSRIKEKFDKCVKEKLLEFCDVLDVPVAKTTTKKEDIVTKLLDFLAVPYATTDVLLSEKDKSGTSRKRQGELKSSSSKSEAPTGKRSARKRRKTEDNAKVMEEKNASESEDESEKGEDEDRENGAPGASEDEVAEHSENEEKVDDSKDESEEEEEQELKSSSKKKSSGKSKSKEVAKGNKAIPAKLPKKTPAKSSSKQSKVDDNNDINPTISTKKRSRETSTKMSSTQKSMSKEKSGKKTVTEQKNKRKKVASGPTENELREAICEILKEVDFNKATFTDIVKQLAKKFDADLTPMRSTIKLMIQEELTKMAEDDEDEDEEKGDTEKEENPGKPVKV